MGCGASAQQQSSNDKYEDSEGEISDHLSDSSVNSDTSTASSRSVTRVTSTRGRVASSSTTTPKLAAHMSNRVYDTHDTMDDAFGVGIPSGASGKNETPRPPETFLFGDFNVDPKDVARQRVERLNRVRRPSRSFDTTEARKNKPMEVFVLNDFVISDVDEDAYLPELSAASIQVPTGFKRLSSLTVRTLIGHTDRVKALVLGREEKSFLSAAITDCVVAMSDLTGQELNCYPGHEATIVALAISRDGKLFASSARDGSIGVWEYSTNREHAMKKQVRLFSPEEASNAISISLAFSYNARYLIAGGQDGRCRVWDLDRLGVALEYERHNGVIVSVSPHPTDFLVATASGDRTIHVWRYDTGENISRLVGHDSAVISVSFTLDGSRLLSNDDRTCRVWDARSGECEITVSLDNVLRGAGRKDRRKEEPKKKKERDSKSVELLDAFQRRFPSFAHKLQDALGGPNTTAARAAQMERVTAKTIFTVSALFPGTLSGSYFAVACTTGEVYVVNLATGLSEASIPTKAPVFAMHSGSTEKLIFGDIFGNIYSCVCR